MHSYAVRARALELARAGHPDAAVARATGLARSTVRDLRRSSPAASCPRCWRRSSRCAWTAETYAFLLGLYLGDGYICKAGRTYRLRVSLDARYPGVIADARASLERTFIENAVGEVHADSGSTVILSVYNSHLPCLFPQHGVGPKHLRPIVLEPWQQDAVRAKPLDFLKGCIWSDGCTFINRTGRYEYLTYDFCNSSADIRNLFMNACEMAGVQYRSSRDRVRVNRRLSVIRLQETIGTKT